jgi:large subunit ribosomal protein L10
MTKEEKTKVIEDLVQQLAKTRNFYLTDTSALTAEKTSKLRRECFNKKITMKVVKNSLLKKAIEQTTDRDFKEMIPSIVGNTAVMFSESAAEPAKVIKEFRKTSDKPLLKSAFVSDTIYIGDNQLESLAAIKSKEELIGEIITLLQSPARNVLSALLNKKDKDAEQPAA